MRPTDGEKGGRSWIPGGKCTDLVSVVGSSDSVLALVARSELGEVTVVVTLPVVKHEYTFFDLFAESRRTYIL